MQLPKRHDVIFAVIGVLFVWSILALLKDQEKETAPKESIAVSVEPGYKSHVAYDEDISLATVMLRVYYFVPRDRMEHIRGQWVEEVKMHLDLIKAFHRLQFKGRSSLAYEIHPDIVYGIEDGFFYDSETTARGNPHAWTAIRDELDTRFGPIKRDAGPFEVRVVIYEGVGALGGREQALVSSGFLNTDYAASTIYHELGHAFGLEDEYEYEHSIPRDEDIMGLGRTRPIGQAFLSDKAKSLLGIW